MTRDADLEKIPPSPLTGRQKAAIVVRLLLEEGATPAFSAMPDTLQADLARQFVKMGSVSRSTIAEVVEEFGAAIDTVGITFPRDLDDALGSLEGVISTAAASRLRREAGKREQQSPWESIDTVDADRLAEVVARESPEIAAVILSKLSVPKAAEILGMLPGNMARRITYSISLTGSIHYDTVHRIGLSLATELYTDPAHAFADGPVGRVGEILNAAKVSTRDEVLEGLEAEDEEFAEKVRRSLFAFSDIATRVDGKDIARIQPKVEQADLTVIKSAATGKVEASIDFFLANISQRLAGMIADAAEDRGPAPDSELEAAMGRVVGVIRTMEREGELQLGAPE